MDNDGLVALFIRQHEHECPLRPGAHGAQSVRLAQASISAARPLGNGTRNHRDAAPEGDRLRPLFRTALDPVAAPSSTRSEHYPRSRSTRTHLRPGGHPTMMAACLSAGRRAGNGRAPSVPRTTGSRGQQRLSSVAQAFREQPAQNTFWLLSGPVCEVPDSSFQADDAGSIPVVRSTRNPRSGLISWRGFA